MTLPYSPAATSIAADLGLDVEPVERTIKLLDEGNTIPFITRYRCDLTGGLDEQQIREIKASLERFRALQDRKASILKSIETQGKLDDEIRHAIEQARSIKRLEDLYLPYKTRKQTLATLARQRGFEPLAMELLEGKHSTETLAQAALALVRVDRGVTSLDEVYQGLGHLIAERFSEDVELRSILRRLLWKTGRLVTSAATPAAPQVSKEESSAPESPSQEPVVEAPLTVAVEALVVDSTPAKAQAETVEPDSDGMDEASEAPETEAGIVTTTHALAAEGARSAESAAEVKSDSNGESVSDVPEAVAAATEAIATTTAEAADDGATTEAETGEAGKRKRKKKRNKKKEEKGEFVDYYEFSESLNKLPPHRVLAINRGEKEKAIRVRIDFDEPVALAEGAKRLIPADHVLRDLLETWLKDALNRLIVPSLEREVRRELTERAESHAVSVFATNLRNLLLQPPVGGHTVMALDPGYKRGCQVAVVDQTGTPLDSQVIFVVGNGERRRRGRNWLVEAARRHRVRVIAIGNGTASREAEKLVADLLENELKDSGIAYVMVNEAGASVYSTSPVGRDELPNLDPTLRSAVSIARRLLDPLSELVKISAEHLGVGMYQHDVKAKHLRDSLDAVVESCVNFVGVEANTASPALLRYVSGLNQLSAKRFVEYRNEHGPFRSRREFSEVPGFGEATFVQAAGFLKIPCGEHPFDATWIHPESYGVGERVLERLGYSLEQVRRLLGGRSAPPAASPSQMGSVDQKSSVEMGDAAIEPAHAQAASAATVEESSLPAESVSESQTATEEQTQVAEAPIIAQADSSVPSPLAVETEAVIEPETVIEPASAEEIAEFQKRIAAADVERLAQELGTGTMLVRDILASLLRPGRDPRESLPPPVMRTGATRIEDLEPGMALDGRILNVVDFGVFVDYGLAESGLVHISHLSREFVKDPHQRFAVGQSIRVWVIDVDKSRRRVSLTAIDPAEPAVERTRGPRRRNRNEQQSGDGGAPRAPRPPRGGHAGRGGQARTGSDGQPATQQGRPWSGGQQDRRPSAGGNRGSGQRSGPPPRRGRGRPEQGDREMRPPRKAPPRKPAEPLKKEVAEGKVPMRSFTELMQFYHQKRDES